MLYGVLYGKCKTQPLVRHSFENGNVILLERMLRIQCVVLFACPKKNPRLNDSVGQEKMTPTNPA